MTREGTDLLCAGVRRFDRGEHGGQVCSVVPLESGFEEALLGGAEVHVYLSEADNALDVRDEFADAGRRPLT